MASAAVTGRVPIGMTVDHQVPLPTHPHPEVRRVITATHNSVFVLPGDGVGAALVHAEEEGAGVALIDALGIFGRGFPGGCGEAAKDKVFNS